MAYSFVACLSHLTIDAALSRRSQGGVLGRRDVFDFMHGHSRMTIDPRIPTMPGRSVGGGVEEMYSISCMAVVV